MRRIKSHLLIALLTFGIGLASTSAFIFSAQVPIVEVFDNSDKMLLPAAEFGLDNIHSESPAKPFAEKNKPRFEDYPVTKIYEGKFASLKYQDHDGSEYKVPLQSAIDNQEVEFAGHYIATNWSCGMWCLVNAFIDVKNGKVYWSPVQTEVCLPHLDNEFVCDENFTNVEYRIDSKLIVFFGFRYDKNEEREKGFHYYKFENGRFVHLKSILVKEQRSARQIQIDEFDEKNK